MFGFQVFSIIIKLINQSFSIIKIRHKKKRPIKEHFLTWFSKCLVKPL